MKETAIIILCYLIGSIPFSYLFGRVFGKVDIRARGSGNIGATNVLRTSGVPVALIALSGDLFKGILAAWISFKLGGTTLAAVGSLAAITGHCYPAFLRFRGGKGVATAAGIILFLMPDMFLVLLGVFVASVAITRYVSLGSLLAAAIFPLIVLICMKPWPYIALSFLMAALVIYRHKDNLKRLRQGQESKINEKA
ncbi:MAG: glycerol-3-phosphate 1-O-acyltransferase PlsY [Syntrophomonadaceae bacterium]|nr:glycerol-3-phosphate 1-O-acyltransferase PlsY [Syntrophomonadaceae bacterium]MDD3889365.1 glycerol-3-phosphate 1-O-acyltransferase PlsY [Syntrophomonadaceae bacterium]MDD4548582.1 glycerol-3-phosphate 1-O-acyltransferase PlsY [Syntrophomonadaceae bacterium]